MIAKPVARILLVEDDLEFASLLEHDLRRMGHEVEHAPSIRGARAALESRGCDVALVDLRLRGEAGLDAIPLIRSLAPLAEVIFMSAAATVPAVVEALRRGATDFVEKPISAERLELLIENAAEKVRLARENAALKLHLGGSRSFVPPEELGPKMRGAFATAVQAAALGGPILLLGETGSGKELLARAIHAASGRSSGSLIPVNCSSLDRTLADSELFGHERGAFTGAVERRLGLVEVADKGTLFLDEIGDLPLDVQAKLLRFCESGEFRRVGGTRILHAEVLVVAATNRDLRASAKSGGFREDLLFRLDPFRVVVPPLREHLEDVPRLVEHFLRERGRDPKTLPGAVLDVLLSQSWPGNVRQLRNCIDRLVLKGPIAQLGPKDVPEAVGGQGTLPPVAVPSEVIPLRAVEQAHIRAVLEKCRWNRTHAARLLGVSPRTLYNKIRELGLAAEE